MEFTTHERVVCGANSTRRISSRRGSFWLALFTGGVNGQAYINQKPARRTTRYPV